MSEVAFIIGGSGDIGSQIALHLRDEGYQVYVSHLTNPSKEFESLYLDARDPTSMESSVQYILKKHESISVIVYCISSVLHYRRILETTWEDFSQHHEIQVRGMHSLLLAMKPQIQKKTPTRCVVILSEVCHGTPPTQLSHYTSAKYALLGFVKTLSEEMKASNWIFHLLSPSMVETKLLRYVPSKLIELNAAKTSIKKNLAVQDVAHAVITALKSNVPTDVILRN